MSGLTGSVRTLCHCFRISVVEKELNFLKFCFFLYRGEIASLMSSPTHVGCEEFVIVKTIMSPGVKKTEVYHDYHWVNLTCTQHSG